MLMDNIVVLKNRRINRNNNVVLNNRFINSDNIMI